MKSLKDLKKEQPVWLTVYWCDRCNRAINQNEDKDHFHAEQCGCCKKFRPIDSDWGYCNSHESVYSGRKMFEHDTCSKWEEGKW
jgi:hypothetical protein